MFGFKKEEKFFHFLCSSLNLSAIKRFKGTSKIKKNKFVFVSNFTFPNHSYLNRFSDAFSIINDCFVLSRIVLQLRLGSTIYLWAKCFIEFCALHWIECVSIWSNKDIKKQNKAQGQKQMQLLFFRKKIMSKLFFSFYVKKVLQLPLICKMKRYFSIYLEIRASKLH